MIVSVHIPKTAGTGFGKFLSKAFKDKFLYVYDSCFKCGRFVIAENFLQLGQVLNDCSRHVDQDRLSDQLHKKECIHGHFHASKFQYAGKVIYWLRDPVQRALSSYYHHERHPEHHYTDIPLDKPQLFFHSTANTMSRATAGADPDFVGFTEKFNECIEIFRQKYSISENYIFGFENRNPLKDPHIKYTVDKKLIQLAKHFNQEDIALYKKMKQENELQLSGR